MISWSKVRRAWSKQSVLHNRPRIDRRAEKRPKRLEFSIEDCSKLPPLKDIVLLKAIRERDTIRIIVATTDRSGGRFDRLEYFKLFNIMAGKSGESRARTPGFGDPTIWRTVL